MTTRIFALLTCAAVVYSASSAVLPPTTTVTVVSESSSLRRRQGDEGTIAKRGRVAANEVYMAPAQGEGGYYVHIGCFADKSSDRVVLGMKLVKVDMGAKVCHDYCNAQGAFYMATKNGNECYCSTANDIDYSRLNTGVCDQSCAGDESERCGGNHAFDLYELVLPDESSSHEYVGCYADNVEERAMSDQYISDYMTSTVCRDYCDGKGALYYATKFGDECWCGLSDTFADYEKYGLGTCHMRCTGNQSGACGGHQAFSIYRFIDDRPVVALKTEPTPETIPEMLIDHFLELDSADSIKGEDEEAVFTPRQLGSDPYDGSFTGDGTYYGTTSDGNCAIRSPIPSMYDGMIPVALNSAQYGDSEMCGACIEGEGSGKGSFKAYVMDKCPECSYGDLDFSESGDGRWDISWKFVSCPGGSSKPSFIFEGSSEYYWKIQPRGTKTPVVELKVDGAKGSKTDDNFFEIPGAPYPLDGAQTVETKTMSGETSTQEVSC